MDRYKELLSKVNKKILLAGVALLVCIVALAIMGLTTSEYWTVAIGEEDVILASSKDQAEEIIQGFNDYYLTEGSEDREITISPEITAVKHTIKKWDKKPDIQKFNEVKEAVKYLTLGTKEPKVYKIKGGDTVWSIAKKTGFTLKQMKKMNPKVDLDNVHPGDKLNLYEIKPFAKVTTKEKITKNVKIKHKVKYIKNKKLKEGTTKVKKKGSDGIKEVVAIYTKVNGKVVKKKILSKKITKKPVTAVVYKGTKPNMPWRGKKVANYALKFVGNPYKYGGSSLTHGADCSGFVMAVYAHFGVKLPHDATGMLRYGKSVSLSEARPGDIVIYSAHCAIYIGGGRVVHARNRALGIATSSVYSSVNGGQRILGVRRIFY